MRVHLGGTQTTDAIAEYSPVEAPPANTTRAEHHGVFEIPAVRKTLVGVAAFGTLVSAACNIGGSTSSSSSRPADRPTATYAGMLARQCANNNTLQPSGQGVVHVDVEAGEYTIARAAADAGKTGVLTASDQEALCALEAPLQAAIVEETAAIQGVDAQIAKAQSRENLVQQRGVLEPKSIGELRRERASLDTTVKRARAEKASADVLLLGSTYAELDPSALEAKAKDLETTIDEAQRSGGDWGGAFRELMAEHAAVTQEANASKTDARQAIDDAADLAAWVGSLRSTSDSLRGTLTSRAEAQASVAGPRTARMTALASRLESRIDRDANAIIARAPAFMADHPQGGDDALRADVIKMIESGKSPQEISATVDRIYQSSDEYLSKHPEAIVARVYQEVMNVGTDKADPAALAQHVAEARQMIASGKSVAETRAAISDAIRNSPENWRAHRTLDRDAVYMTQLPNHLSWCGPFSGGMALVALGVSPRDFSTVESVAAHDGQGPYDGLPGNVSIIAHSLEEIGKEKGITIHTSTSEFDGTAAIRQALADGKVVIVNGAMPCCQGHIVALEGLDEHGQIIVLDPFRPEITRWNDGDLAGFILYQHAGDPHPTAWMAAWRDG